MKKHISRIIFWAHLLAILAAVAVGLFVGPLWMLGFIILHRAHVLLFGECALSKVQRRFGGLPEGVNFLQLAARKLLQKNWSLRQAQLADYGLVTAAFALSLIRG